MAGSVFDGSSPLSSPISLLLVQITIIIIISRFFAVLLRYVNQPRVLAEVLGGIILGPTVLGRIPGFQETLFPEKSMPILKAIADLGLVMFLFIVGLELELALLKTTAKAATIVSAVGIILPFACGFAAAVALWNVLGAGITVGFGTFGAFIAVANSITAFPVLARIVAERKLMTTPVGITSITAAALGDVVAWGFLALVVAISNNSGSPVNVVWVFLSTGAFGVFMLAVVRPLLNRGIQSSRFEKNHVTQATVVAAFILAFVSAWITEFLGVHAIFGAFIAGLAMPRHSGFAVTLIEKIEDFITIVLLPLYFTYSGLRTQIGALNTGTAWGMVFLVIAVACTKIVGAGGAAKALGHTVRESLAIGILMNTRGLVELIVLNVGLDAGALNQEIFVVMVLMALVTTFMTTPLLGLAYPPSYIKKRLEARKSAKFKVVEDFEQEYNQHPHLTVWLEKNQDTNQIVQLIGIFRRSEALSVSAPDKPQRLTLRPHAPNEQGAAEEVRRLGSSSDGNEDPSVSLSALRLLQVSDRNSSVLRATWISEETPKDLQLFRSHCQVYGFDPTICMAVTTPGTLAHDLSSAAYLQNATYVVLPWVEPPRETGFFSQGTSHHEVLGQLLEECPMGVAAYVAPTCPVHSSSMGDLPQHHQAFGGMSPTLRMRNLFRHSEERDEDGEGTVVEEVESLPVPSDRSRLSSKRVVVFFFGGRDSRAAVLLALQLARQAANTIVHILRMHTAESELAGSKAAKKNMSSSLPAFDDEANDDAVFIEFLNSLAARCPDTVATSAIDTHLTLEATIEQLAKASLERDRGKKDKTYESTAPSIPGVTIRDIAGPEVWHLRPSLVVVPHSCEAQLLPSKSDSRETSDTAMTETSSLSVPVRDNQYSRQAIATVALGPIGAACYLSSYCPPLVVVRAPFSSNRSSENSDC